MRPDQNDTDQELFRRIAGGDQVAFTAFFHKYRSQLFAYAMALTKTTAASEEVVQEVFLKIWAGREKLSAIENPPGYLYRIGKNVGVDYLRKLASGRRAAVQLSTSDNDNTTLESLDVTETRRLISEAMEQLTTSQREVFRLSRYEGLNYDEIAEKLGISRNTVKNHLVSALKTVRSYLSSQYDPVVALILTAMLEKLLS
ncbi:MAG: RNA polymerase sigma-70 factor [Flavisolibacter sp.]